MNTRKDIYSEIDLERCYQEEKWGNSNDDTLDMAQFAGFINEYATGCTDRTWKTPVRKRMVKVAALAVAAIETLDRKKSRRNGK
jgi:hypothetical protein